MDVCDFESSSSSSDSSSPSFESDSSSDNEQMLVDSIKEALQVATTILDDLEMEIEDETIRWRSKHDGGVMIQDLTDDDAISHFRFQKSHLQEVADKPVQDSTNILPDQRHLYSSTMVTIQLHMRPSS
jgi:hypothetical protein